MKFQNNWLVSNWTCCSLRRLVNWGPGKWNQMRRRWLSVWVYVWLDFKFHFKPSDVRTETGPFIHSGLFGPWTPSKCVHILSRLQKAELKVNNGILFGVQCFWRVQQVKFKIIFQAIFVYHLGVEHCVAVFPQPSSLKSINCQVHMCSVTVFNQGETDTLQYDR